MTLRDLKGLLGRATESIVALALVVICFLSMLGILSLSFPRGTSLTDLMNSGEFVTGVSGAARLDFALTGAIEARNESFAAFLSRVFRSVKEKPAGSIVWGDARRGTPLQDRHAVQSFSDSGAIISFDESNELELGENSLVVVRRLERHAQSRKRTANMLVLEGDLAGRVGGPGQESLEVNIATAKSSMKIDSDGGNPANFKVSVNPDESSTFAVYKGTAEVTTAAGRTLVVGQNQSLTVDAAGRPGEIKQLPFAPSPSAPAPGTVYSYRSTPPPVDFEWSAQDGADEYRLTLARDERFADILLRERLSRTGLTHRNLRSGRYFWKVSGTRAGLESAPSETGSFEIVRDLEPPALHVRFPEGSLGTSDVLVEGSVEPGSAVFIAGEPVGTMDSGEFTHRLTLDPGLNVVVIEAFDTAGNSSYQSELLNAKY